MGLPTEPVTLDPARIAELNDKLAEMRHNINNQLALMVAALELVKRKPDMAARFLDNMAQQPDRIIGEVKTFSDCFEMALGIGREG